MSADRWATIKNQLVADFNNTTTDEANHQADAWAAYIVGLEEKQAALLADNAAKDKAIAVLKKIDEGGHGCPICGGVSYVAFEHPGSSRTISHVVHRSDCELAAALREKTEKR